MIETEFEPMPATVEMVAIGPINELAAALAAAQSVMPNAVLNCINPHFKSRYSDLAAIREASLPALTKNGLSIIQLPTIINGAFVLRTILAHKTGQYLEAFYPLTIDKPQAMGSQLTYARRYSWAAMIALAAEEDDDANAAQSTAKNGKVSRAAVTITPKQVQELSELCYEVSADEAKFCRYLGVTTLAALSADMFEQAKEALESKRDAHS